MKTPRGDRDSGGGAARADAAAGKALRFALSMLGGCLVIVLAVALMTRGAPAPPTAPPRSNLVLAPAATRGSTANEVFVRGDRSGHFFLDAEVNGAPVRFLLDTGASLVSLTPDDAQAAGLGANLSYSLTTRTAHGEAKAARATLRSVQLGQLEIADVAAVVMEEPMPFSLLGMSFLNRLRGYSIRDGVLTIEW